MSPVRSQPFPKRIFFLFAWAFLAACGGMTPTQVISSGQSGISGAEVQPAAPTQPSAARPASSETDGGGGNHTTPPPDDTRAQPTPLGGGVFAPAPNPEVFCSITVTGSYSVSCLSPKTNRADMKLKGSVHYGRGCLPVNKGAALRVVNNGVPAEFIDIVTAIDGGFQLSLNARNPPSWEIYLIDVLHVPYYLTLGDPATTTFDLIPCRDDACVVGEGKAPLEANVQFEKPVIFLGGSGVTTPPECSGKTLELIQEAPKEVPKKSTEDTVYHILN